MAVVRGGVTILINGIKLDGSRAGVDTENNQFIGEVKMRQMIN